MWEECWVAGGNREGCCLGGGTRDVRVGGALIIAFSDEVGEGILQEELATPLPRRGGQGPEGSNPLGICFVLASPTSQLLCVGWELLCAETSPCILIWQIFPFRCQLRKIQVCAKNHLFFFIFYYLSPYLTWNCRELEDGSMHLKLSTGTEKGWRRRSEHALTCSSGKLLVQQLSCSWFPISFRQNQAQHVPTMVRLV